MVKIKICGLTRHEDVEAAAKLGADFLGFNFYPKSKRYLEPETAGKLAADLPRWVRTVGVFVNEDPEVIKRIHKLVHLDLVQLHGDETPQYCSDLGLPSIKALRVASSEDLEPIEDYDVHAMLVDSRTVGYGGSGVKVDWALAAEAAAIRERLILAGGLDPDNVAEGLDRVRPWAVDVASGVESAPGIKDRAKMKKFIEAVRNAT